MEDYKTKQDNINLILSEYKLMLENKLKNTKKIINELEEYCAQLQVLINKMGKE